MRQSMNPHLVVIICRVLLLPAEEPHGEREAPDITAGCSGLDLTPARGSKSSDFVQATKLRGDGESRIQIQCPVKRHEDIVAIFISCDEVSTEPSASLFVGRPGYRAVTPVRPAAPAVRADAHTTADQRPVTRFRTAGQGGRGEQVRPEFLVSVQHLYTQRKPVPFELCESLANRQSARSFHCFFAVVM